jgi:hypothetical protein
LGFFVFGLTAEHAKFFLAKPQSRNLILTASPEFSGAKFYARHAKFFIDISQIPKIRGQWHKKLSI